MASDLDIAWAAGLYEGEGSASVSSGQRQPRVSVQMTDEDIVRRFAAIVGRGNVRRYEAYQPGRKPQWQWSVQSRADVLHVLVLLLPYLGVRRTERAMEVMESAGRIGAPRNGGGGRYASGLCKRGHDLSDPIHQYVHGGVRYCRTCRLRREAEYRTKRRVS